MTKFRPASREPVTRDVLNRFGVAWALFASAVAAVVVAVMAVGALA